MKTDLSYFLSRHLEEIEQKKQAIEREQATLPSGKLLITRDRRWKKWYCSHSGQKSYIPKENQEFAEKLAKKRYLEALLTDCNREIDACKAYLKHHKKEPASVPYLSPDNPYYPLIFSSDSRKQFQEWLHSEYPCNSYHPEQRMHKSISGNLLRSKSEVLIDELLFRYHLPYHYEELHTFPDGSICYPDFKIYSQKKKRFFLWEHLGIMDNPSYSFSAQKKIEKYIQNGIIPQRDLIITTETKDMPLDYQLVNLLIHHYLL